MKKHLLKIVLLVILSSLCIFALSSCDIVNQTLDQALDLICEHEWTVEETVDPTCTEDGAVISQCTKCRKKSTEVVPALGHSIEPDKFGYREDDGHAEKCTVCGYVGAKTAHTSSGPATEEEHELCTVCGFVITPALNHEHEYTLLEADSSYHWYECICGEKDGVSAHEGGTAKCDALAKCSVCETAYGSYDYSNHTLYVSSERAATCAVGGLKITACEGCEYTLTELTPHLEHVWSVDEVSCTVGKVCTLDGCGTVVPASGHSYSLVSTTAATCTEDGYETYTCSACKDSYTNLVEHSHGHTVSAWEVQAEVALAGDPCKYQLTYVGICGICGESDTKTEVVERHEYRVTVYKEATCTAEGIKTYTCSVPECGHTYNEGYTDENAHEWGEGVTAEGVTTYTCACGETRTVISSKTETNSSVSSDTLKDVGEVELKDASIALDSETADALNGNVNISANTQKKEDVTDVEISPEMGEQIGDADIFEFTMSDDNGEVESFAGTVTVKIPYTLTKDDDPDCIAVWWLTEDEDGNPTLEYVEAKYSGGYVVFETEHFSYYTVTRMTPAERCQYRGHQDKILINPATCTEDGYETHVCIRCGRTEVIKGESAKGHDFVEEYNDEATCTKHGKVGHKCNSCGKTHEEHKPAKGHEWELDSKAAASCTAPGHVTNKCGHCGELDKEIIPQRSHEYVETVVAPTCTEFGYTLHVCKSCNDNKKDNYENPRGHRYSEEIVEATCTEDGYIKKICSCGDEHIEKIKKTGHKWNLKNPTCGEAKYCLVCSYVDKVATGKHDMKGGICTVCGEGCNHKYIEVERIEATCISEGQIVKACSCGSRVTEIIAKTSHTWNLDEPTCGTDKLCTVCKTVAATATGEHTIENGVCTVCGNPCPHSYSVVNVVAPDCVNYGYTTEKCIFCDDEKKTNVTAALGHTEGKTCGRCGKTLEIGEVGYYTNMVDSFLKLGLNVELHDLIIYPYAQRRDEYCTVEIDELWLTEDAEGNLIGYGRGWITVLEDGEFQRGEIRASVYDNMLYITLDVDAGEDLTQHNAIIYPLDVTTNPIGIIGSIYTWYKSELYPILNALISANTSDADRIIGGLMNAVCTESILADGSSVYSLDVDKVLALNEKLTEKNIKAVYEEILCGSYADLKSGVLELLDTTAYDALNILSGEGISREDILGAVYSFMDMASSSGAPMSREEFVTEILATEDMKKTLAELLVGMTEFEGTADELVTNISETFDGLAEMTVYQLVFGMSGIEYTDYNLSYAKEEVEKIITELFGYFTLDTKLSADGRIDSIDFALMDNPYITGDVTVYFGYTTNATPEDIISDTEGYEEIMAALTDDESERGYYLVSGYKTFDDANYNNNKYEFIVTSVDEALEVIGEYGLAVKVEISRVEVSCELDNLTFDEREVTEYCGWTRFSVKIYCKDNTAPAYKIYRVEIAEDGTVTETLKSETDGSGNYYIYRSCFYNTETGDWATAIPYYEREHSIVEDKDKRVEPVGCTGVGKAYYYCEDCGIEYSNDIINGHNYETALELVNPEGSCTDGVNVTNTCTKCGDTSSELVSWHYKGVTLRVDLAEHGGCGGYIEIRECACGKESYVSENCHCSMNWNSNSYVDEEGRVVRVETRTCSRCGLRIQQSSYEVRSTDSCIVKTYHSGIISIGDVAATFEYTSSYQQHDYQYTAVLDPGATSCEDGVTVTQTCRYCGYGYEEYYTWHREIELERIDLAELGCKCGGYVTISGCACGQHQYIDYRSNSFCEFDSTYNDISWVEGAVVGNQYSSEGNQHFDYSGYTLTCSVTDPEQCGFIIRYADCWIKNGCYAERYRIYQIGYDPDTGTAAYELVTKSGSEVRQYHAYGEGVSIADGNGMLYTCADCGSTYTYINSYDDVNGISKSEHIAVNNLNTFDAIRFEEYDAWMNSGWEDYWCYTYADGSIRDYKCTVVNEAYDAPFGENGYKYSYIYSGNSTEMRLDQHAYTYVNGRQLVVYYLYEYADGSWSRCDYTYNPENYCERTSVLTNSYGERTESNSSNHAMNWATRYPTCTQDGCEYEYCVYCDYEERYGIMPANGHAWVAYGDTYVCNRCGLENVNGADGAVVLEDLTASYGLGENYVIGYYAKDYTTYIYSLSILVMGEGGEYEEIFLDNVEILDHSKLRAKVFSIEAVNAAAKELGYAEGEYLVRFAFVPLGADGSFDYAITIEEFDPLSNAITGNSLVTNFVKAGQTLKITVAPEKSGHFDITSNANGDTRAYLYDANGDRIADDDDSGEGNNFRIQCYLEAGCTYTLEVMWYDSNNSGDIPVQSIFTEK